MAAFFIGNSEGRGRAVPGRVEIGEQGARMLLQLMSGQKPAQSSIELEYQLVVRANT